MFVIRRNTNSNTDHVPFLLKPAGKETLWGGTRLNDDFSKNLDCDPLAETWECSTHPDGPSIVDSGRYKGITLTEVIKKHPDFVGSHPDSTDGLPILIKFIDAYNDLSVQVHPTDEYANIHENGQRGKSEMWYVVEASKYAKLVYGFRHEMSRELVERCLKEGTLENHLLVVPVKKDDVFFIPAGQVHAICAGCLVAEIQESSNLTYRLYDYDRMDKHGNKRELHIDKALDVMNYASSDQPRQPMKIIKYEKGKSSELLCRCKYFEVNKVILDTQRCKEFAHFKTNANSFMVLQCVNGCGVLYWNENERLDFFRGDTIFIPASSIDVFAHGEATLLQTTC